MHTLFKNNDLVDVFPHDSLTPAAGCAVDAGYLARQHELCVPGRVLHEPAELHHLCTAAGFSHT